MELGLGMTQSTYSKFASPAVTSWLRDCSYCSGDTACEEMAKDFGWLTINALEQVIAFIRKETVKSSSSAVLDLTKFCRLLGVLTKKSSFLWMQEVTSNKVDKISQKNGHKKVKTFLSPSFIILFRAADFSTHWKYSGLTQNIGLLPSSWRGSVRHPLAAAAYGVSVALFQNCTVFSQLFVDDVRLPMKHFSRLQKWQPSGFFVSLAFFFFKYVPN